MNIILFGAPGSGKGTQTKKIAKYFSYGQISTGDLVRSEIESGTLTGVLIKEIVDGGKFPSDDIIIKLVDGVYDASTKGYVFDGFPRTTNQAEALEKMLTRKSQSIDLVIKLDVDDETIKRRILGRYSCKECGAIYNKYFHPTKEKEVCDICQSRSLSVRADDTEEAIITRLETYHLTTEAVLRYFEKKVEIFSIDGTQDIDIIFAQIKNEIKACEENKKAI